MCFKQHDTDYWKLLPERSIASAISLLKFISGAISLLTAKAKKPQPTNQTTRSKPTAFFKTVKIKNFPRLMSSGAQYVRCQSRLSDDPWEKPRKIFALLPVGHLKHGTFGMKMLNHTQGWDIKRALAVVAGRRRPRSAAPLLLSRAPGVFLSARSPRRRLVEGTGVLPEWDVSWGSSISSWRHKFRGVGGQKQRDGTDGRRAGTPPPPPGLG